MVVLVVRLEPGQEGSEVGLIATQIGSEGVGINADPEASSGVFGSW